jgi:hypothetical protein
MPIEIFPKPKVEIKPLALIFLIISVFLVAAAGISYIVILNFTQKTKAEILQKRQTIEKTPEESSLEARMLSIQTKIENFKTLLSQHKKASNVFALLEEKCHPKVWFGNFSFNSQNAQVQVSGTADSFISLEQQMQILKGEKSIKSINLSGISLSEDKKVSFSLSLALDPQILQ